MDATYFVAMSLDGYIADASGGVDWLDTLDGDRSQESYQSFFATVDGLLMGDIQTVADIGDAPVNCGSGLTS